MANVTRATVAGIGASLGIVAVATIWSPTGPKGAVQVTCLLAACVGAVIGALLWARRWPTRTQAIWFAVLSNASIALAVLAQSNPTGAMVACTTFATMAGYIALFHTAPLMAYNIVIATGVGAVEGIRMAHSFNAFTAVCAFAAVLTLNLAVPFGIQAVVHVLGADAVLAEHDELTGLLTRRAFHRRVRAQLKQDGDPLAHLVVTVIDLDRFKQINDRYGHSTGDPALVAVAGALRDSTGDTAVIGRAGGEEFVVADIWHPDDVGLRAQKLCDAIAALPFGLTASVGTAGHHVDGRARYTGEILRADLGSRRRDVRRQKTWRQPNPPLARHGRIECLRVSGK
jgi:diguanylate cyclase (GGDEF)-like protein